MQPFPQEQTVCMRTACRDGTTCSILLEHARIQSPHYQVPRSPSLLPHSASSLPSVPHPQVVRETSAALDISPGHPKALLRRGKAYYELQRWEESQADLQQVVAIEGTAEHAEAVKELTKVHQVSLFALPNFSMQCTHTRLRGP